MSKLLIFDHKNTEIKMIISFEIPIRTISEANTSEHWTKRRLRRKSQQFFVRLSYMRYVKDLQLPCKILITRIGPRRLDFDNLCSSQKGVVDALCDCIIPGLAPGRADGDERIKISYAQEIGKCLAVRIEIDDGVV